MININQKFGGANNMVIDDPEMREKVVGLWQISTDPLIFTIHGDKIFIRDSRKNSKKYPPVIDLPMSVFMALTPKEIIEQIDKKNGTKTLRTDFSGFNRSPFSSQN